MRNLLPLIVLTVSAFALLYTSPIFADSYNIIKTTPTETTTNKHTQVSSEPRFLETLSSFDTELDPSKCGKFDEPLIDVKYKVVNDMNVGYYGFWSYGSYERHIRVFKTSAKNVYCAVVMQGGSFSGIEGALDPVSGEELTGYEKGTFNGGYRIVVSGKLLNEPAWPTTGILDTYNYDCSYENGLCAGNEGWLSKYFISPYGTVTEWWGWHYKTNEGQVWINSSGDKEFTD